MTPAQRHMGRIKDMPCICCRLMGIQTSGVEVHHIREEREARNDWLTLPLCKSCHTGSRGVHGDKTFLRMLKLSELGLLAHVIRDLEAT